MSSSRPRSPRTGARGATGSRGASARRGASGNRRRPGSRASGRSRGGARRRPRGRWGLLRRVTPAQWCAVVLISAVVLLGLVWRSDEGESLDTAALCTLTDSRVTLSPEQIGNARTIAQVGRDRGLPDRAVVIALATAMQESSLRNLDHGDRDSLGLFQQRPSQGWGTPEQVQDPVYAAGIFYDRLVEVPGWETGELTLVADSVQRSAYPLAYARWTGMAEELVRALASAEDPCA
ncbi:hypothetical protein [Blastococcus sp. SYSU D00813]